MYRKYNQDWPCGRCHGCQRCGKSSSIHTYPRALRCLGAAFRAGFRTRLVAFALDDLVLARLAFLAWVALLATAGGAGATGGAPERVFIVMMTTRVVILVTTSVYDNMDG